MVVDTQDSLPLAPMRSIGRRDRNPSPRLNEAEPSDGRGDRIRTCDFSLPKRALYQAELRPVLRGSRLSLRWVARAQSPRIPA